MFKVSNVALAAALALSVDYAASAGCYPAFSSGAEYDKGALVSFNSTNFQCVNNDYSVYCSGNQPPGAPGTLATVAWTSLGACTGSQAVPAPTAKPTPARVTAGGGGCPKKYVAGTQYDGEEVVSLDGVVYKCKGTPGNANHCATGGFEIEEGLYWKGAWEVIGSCEGVIPPTASPVAPSAAGGCPKAWADSTAYKAGDRVSIGNLIYECDNLYYGHCPYREPGAVPGDESWNKIGGCDGTIKPTAAPTLDPDAPGCPKTYVAGSEYQGGDKVVSAVDGLVYECKAWPYSAFCPLTNFEPGSDNTALGWIKKGSCDGTISPTTSPTHPAGDMSDPGGCNHPYGKFSLDTYTPGTRIEYNQFIFECKSDIHYSKYCKQEAYSPAGIYWSLAWNKVGWCDGTFAPTKSPSATPSVSPSAEPSKKPSASPSDEPSLKPSASPSDEPSLKPSADPSKKPSAEPSLEPSLKPSADPSKKPSAEPSLDPSKKPSASPSDQPS